MKLAFSFSNFLIVVVALCLILSGHPSNGQTGGGRHHGTSKHDGGGHHSNGGHQGGGDSGEPGSLRRTVVDADDVVSGIH